MRKSGLRNWTGRIILMAAMAMELVFFMVLAATTSHAQTKVVVIPMTKTVQLPPTGPMAPVPKTGQTATHVDGDDGDLEKGVAIVPASERFQYNSNGTVTDRLTGLIWLKDGNCQVFFDGDATGVNEWPWENAIYAANMLKSGRCGLTDGSQAGDWRLPNIRELKSLVDYGRYNPALPENCLLAATTIASSFYYYWTSTTYAVDPTGAWSVYFSSGDEQADYKSSSGYVRAVRGGQ